MSLSHTLIFGAVPEGDRGTEKSHLSCEHLPVPLCPSTFPVPPRATAGTAVVTLS